MSKGAVLAIIALYMELPVWMVMVVLFIRSIGTAFHSPALNAVTPLLVSEDRLTKCAGYSQSLKFDLIMMRQLSLFLSLNGYI